MIKGWYKKTDYQIDLIAIILSFLSLLFATFGNNLMWFISLIMAFVMSAFANALWHKRLYGK